MKTGGYGPVSTNQLIVSFIPVFPMLYLQPDQGRWKHIIISPARTRGARNK